MQIAAPCASGRSNGPSNHPRYRVCDFSCAVSCWSGFVGWCMSEFVEVKTAELTGPALDWAVAYSLNGTKSFFSAFGARMLGRSILREVVRGEISPGTKWNQGGKLVDAFNVDFNTQGVDVDGAQLIEATVQDFESMQCWAAEGETRLEAMCRAIVAAKLGDVVQVPEELEVVK